jgi:hypothetical protein
MVKKNEAPSVADWLGDAAPGAGETAIVDPFANDWQAMPRLSEAYPFDGQWVVVADENEHALVRWHKTRKFDAYARRFVDTAFFRTRFGAAIEFEPNRFRANHE